MTTTILQGDNTAILPTLDAASVQCIVTSPPYYGLRDYGIPPTTWPAVEFSPLAGLPAVTVPAQTCCLGLESDPLAYVAHLVHVWRLLWRVLRDDGICWLNLGDSYNANWRGGGLDTASNKQAKNRGTVAFMARSGTSAKQLLGIPWRVALALQADGWYLRSDVVWSKPNPMPESVTDRPTKAHEYVFLLSKQERYYYDAEAVAEAVTGGAHGGGTKDRERNCGGRTDGYTRPPGGWNPAERTTRNRRTVWSIATQPYSGAHFAVMPEALIDPCIRAGSAAQACEACGAAWERQIEKTGYPDPEYTNDDQGRMKASGDIATDTQRRKVLSGARHAAFKAKNPDRFVGFRPTCRCDNAGTARSIVLDPYGGSGTVGRVAERLQRNAVLIELNPSYIELQDKRLNGVQMELLV